MWLPCLRCRPVRCEPCAPGSVSGTVGQPVCALCNPGEQQPLSGQSKCEPCAPKAPFCAVVHSPSVCAPVVLPSGPAGKATSLLGRVVCADVPPGRYANVPGLLQGLECPPGFNASGFGATNCGPWCVCARSRACVFVCVISVSRHAHSWCCSCLCVPVCSAAGRFSPRPGSTNCTLCPAGKFALSSGLASWCARCCLLCLRACVFAAC
jgi:hypothetical protein